MIISKDSILQKAYSFVYDTFSTYQLLVLSGEMAFPCVFENTVTIFFQLNDKN